MLFTGDLVSGKKAKEMGLVFQSATLKELDDAVLHLTEQIKGVPKNQLMMTKLMVNQAYENMGTAQHTDNCNFVRRYGKTQPCRSLV